MGKLAQYRLLKEVKKMLDTPVKSEEAYGVSTAPMYIGDKGSRSENQESNPNHSLRKTQVLEIASRLLQQISRMEKLLKGGSYGIAHDDSRVTIDNIFTDLAIAFAELDGAIIFTEAEKIVQRQKLAKLEPQRGIRPHLTSTNEETLAHLRLQIEDWQLEIARKQKKVNRVETTIRDLGLNVNDIRCSQILNEKKQAIGALEATITTGARLCEETCGKLQGMFASGYREVA